MWNFYGMEDEVKGLCIVSHFQNQRFSTIGLTSVCMMIVHVIRDKNSKRKIP